MCKARLSLRRDWVAAFLLLCALAPYASNLDAFFLSDDFVLLSWTRVESFAQIAGFFDPNVEWFYRPAVKLVYWVGQSAFGFRAAPFHLLSLLLHLANAYLLYRLVSRSGLGWTAGLAAGLLFMLDPHHAETVSWASAIGDLLGTLCVLANLLLLRRYLDSGRPIYAAPALAMFVAGLLARETVLLLPGFALLYLMIVAPATTLQRWWHSLFVWLGGYVVIAVGYLAALRLGSANGSGGMARGGLEFRPLNPDSLLLGLLDYAHRLVPGGEHLANAPLEVLRVLVWVEWAILLLLAFVLWRLRLRLMLFGLAWLLFAPLAFVFFSPPTDRYFYLPSVGFAILFGCLLGRLPALVARRERAFRMGAIAFACLSLAVLLFTRGADLTSRVATWRAAGHASGGIVNDMRQSVPEPEDYSAFYFVDIPIFLNGVPVFQNGLQQAVQETYHNTTIAANALGCDQLADMTEFPRYSYFFRYKPNGLTPLPSAQDCR
ncbi:MAG: glycosyltransferase family 39 protein [Chloroflexota bacterium]|nr:glycosyltransferase family 39 protein [Chloroflexota bacterium]MDQ5867257.1 glycosyltransferase family 39 protein [Chloroflexota bacterium]